MLASEMISISGIVGDYKHSNQLLLELFLWLIVHCEVYPTCMMISRIVNTLQWYTECKGTFGINLSSKPK